MDVIYRLSGCNLSGLKRRQLDELPRKGSLSAWEIVNIFLNNMQNSNKHA